MGDGCLWKAAGAGGGGFDPDAEVWCGGLVRRYWESNLISANSGYRGGSLVVRGARGTRIRLKVEVCGSLSFLSQFGCGRGCGFLFRLRC